MAKFVRDLFKKKGDAIYSVRPQRLRPHRDRTDGRARRRRPARDRGCTDLEGIVSERDYARQVILKGRSSQDTPVSDIMTSKVICVDPERTIEECMALMTERRIRHLPGPEGRQGDRA